MSLAKFKITPRKFTCIVNVNNSARDGTGSTSVFATGAAGQTELNPSCSIVAKGATTEGMVRGYSDDGSTKRLIVEIPVQGWTPSAQRPVLRIPFEIPHENLLLPTTSDRILFSTQNGDAGFDILGNGWDFA